MSLNFDLSRIPLETRTVVADRDAGPMEGDWKAGDRIMARNTNGLIWACLAVGLRGIDEKTVDEFCYRLALYQELNGDWFSPGHPLTSDAVRAHIGLSTNVSPETRTKWTNRILDSWNRDRVRREDYARQKAEDERVQRESAEALGLTESETVTEGAAI